MPFSLITKTSRTENNVVYSTTLLSMVKKVNLGWKLIENETVISDKNISNNRRSKV